MHIDCVLYFPVCLNPVEIHCCVHLYNAALQQYPENDKSKTQHVVSAQNLTYPTHSSELASINWMFILMS